LSKIVRKIRETRLPRFPLYKPSSTLIIILFIAVAVFILGGGVYDIMKQPLVFLPTPTNPSYLYAGMTDQSINESLVFAIFLIMGISGLFLAYMSTRHAYRPREARISLLMGVTLLAIAFLGCEILIRAKGV